MNPHSCRFGRRAWRWSITVAVLLIGALGAGCAGQGDDTVDSTAQAPPSAVPARRVERQLVEVPDAYVGKIADSDALVAVTFTDGIVRVYLCDGGDTDGGEIAQWFEGPWDGTSEVTLTGGPFQLTLAPEGNGIAGHLTTSDGEQLPFTASLPTTEDDGLYETQVLDPVTGSPRAKGHTIVLGSDEQGAIAPPQTICTTKMKTVVLADGTTAQVPIEVCRARIG